MKKASPKEVRAAITEIRTEQPSPNPETRRKWIAGFEEGNTDKFLHENFIICQECGSKLWILTEDHLAQHGLTMSEYRQTYGYDTTTPLQCRSLSRIFALLA